MEPCVVIAGKIKISVKSELITTRANGFGLEMLSLTFDSLKLHQTGAQEKWGSLLRKHPAMTSACTLAYSQILSPSFRYREPLCKCLIDRARPLSQTHEDRNAKLASQSGWQGQACGCQNVLRQWLIFPKKFPRPDDFNWVWSFV